MSTEEGKLDGLTTTRRKIMDNFLPIDAILGFALDPVSLVVTLGGSVVSMALLIPILNVIFMLFDNLVFFVDDRIVDKLPPFLKDPLQKSLINRLEKRVLRYKEIIKKISD